jgi:hypothetical protein
LDLLELKQQGSVFYTILFVIHICSDTIEPAKPHKEYQQKNGGIEVMERETQKFSICED